MTVQLTVVQAASARGVNVKLQRFTPLSGAANKGERGRRSHAKKNPKICKNPEKSRKSTN